MSELRPFPRYERRGQCNRCGQCCVNEGCEHFTPATDGSLATCHIHDQDREPKCVDFPQLPPILFEGCGYWFYDRWEDKELRFREV